VTPQLRGPFDFLATHFVNRLVDELNDVELIEGDRHPGPMLVHASLVACDISIQTAPMFSAQAPGASSASAN